MCTFRRCYVSLYLQYYVWYKCTVLRIRIRNPESSAFLTPGSGMEYNTDPGSEIQDKHLGSYFREPNSFFKFWLKIHKIFVNSVLWIRIRDGKIQIRDKNPDPQDCTSRWYEIYYGAHMNAIGKLINLTHFERLPVYVPWATPFVRRNKL